MRMECGDAWRRRVTFFGTLWCRKTRITVIQRCTGLCRKGLVLPSTNQAELSHNLATYLSLDPVDLWLRWTYIQPAATVTGSICREGSSTQKFSIICCGQSFGHHHPPSRRAAVRGRSREARTWQFRKISFSLSVAAAVLSWGKGDG